VTLGGEPVLLRVTVRTAASPEIGSGHVARTVAVANELQRIGADVRWACDADTLPSLHERGVMIDRIHVLRASATAGRHSEIEASDMVQASDAAETAAVHDVPPDWILVDSYQLGASWQRAARASGAKIAAFDDLMDRPIDADLVVNAAASADAYTAVAPRARTLVGLRYAIIGDPSRPPAAGPGSLLLAFGAADPGNLTEATLRALAARFNSPSGGAPKTVMQVSRNSRCHERVRALAGGLGWASFAPEGPTSPGTPVLAIGAASVGLLERMQAGVPSIVLVAAPNQRALARMAEGAGAAIIVASVEAACTTAVKLLSDSATLARMAACGKASVDGKGAARVTREMNRITGVHLRRACMEDAALLHRWRNDPSVRAVSHSMDEIPWDTHVRWLEASLRNGDRHVLVAERHGIPVGTLRFDVSADSATVSIAVDPRLHGTGLGPAILDAGDPWLRTHDRRVRLCRAEIRAGNEASTRAFTAAGYLVASDSYQRRVAHGSEP